MVTVMTHMRPPAFAPELVLRPELARLVDVGTLERARAFDGGREVVSAFDELARAAARRGEITLEQAAALAALLGLGHRPANDFSAG